MGSYAFIIVTDILSAMNQTTITLVVLMVMAGLLGVVMVEAVMTQQTAEARGCNTSVAFNASQGRCFGH